MVHEHNAQEGRYWNTFFSQILLAWLCRQEGMRPSSFSFSQLLLQWCFVPVILLCLSDSRGLNTTSSLIHAYSCTESLSLSHLLSLCLFLLLDCHLASSSPLLSLSVFLLCFLITTYPMPVSHLTLPVLQQLWWEMQSPWRKSQRWEKAWKSHSRSPGSGSTKDTFVTTAEYSISLRVPTTCSLLPTALPHFLCEARCSKELNYGSDHVLGCPVSWVRLEVWWSTQREAVPTRAFQRPWCQRWLRSHTDLIACWHAEVETCLKICLRVRSSLCYFTMGF